MCVRVCLCIRVCVCVCGPAVVIATCSSPVSILGYAPQDQVRPQCDKPLKKLQVLVYFEQRVTELAVWRLVFRFSWALDILSFIRCSRSMLEFLKQYEYLRQV